MESSEQSTVPESNKETDTATEAIEENETSFIEGTESIALVVYILLQEETPRKRLVI